MKINEPSLDRAVKMAQRSPQKRFMTGAVIARGDREVSTGWSHMSSLRLSTVSSIHAEIHALGRGRHVDLYEAVAYIANISRKSGNVTLAKPCFSCAISLYAAGIRYAVYTIDKSNYGVLDLTKDLSGLKVYEIHKPKD